MKINVFAEIMGYFSRLGAGKIILWCYLFWYLLTVYQYFDPKWALWLNAIGISAIVGTALLLSVSSESITEIPPWQLFRLYAMPFCVSTFSSLTQGRHFFLVFSSRHDEIAVNTVVCMAFICLVKLMKVLGSRKSEYST